MTFACVRFTSRPVCRVLIRPAICPSGAMRGRNIFRRISRNREASSELWNLSGKTPVLGEAMGARLLNEMLLFSCMVAFVTGVVIAGATLLG
jgi:hypothetical protein